MDDADDTALLLNTIPGGRELIAWFAGPINFGDAEVHSLHLDRTGASALVIEVMRGSDRALVTFALRHWIDVRIDGFSNRNVIDGLILRRAGERGAASWEIGVGMIPGDVEIEMRPCFGANGIIRARIERISLKPVAEPMLEPDFQSGLTGSSSSRNFHAPLHPERHVLRAG